MNISLKPFYGKVFENNSIFRINNGDNIFYDFDKKLKKFDININTLDKKSENSKWDVYCDVPFFWEIRKWVHLTRNIEKSILFCFESPLINPFSHISVFHKLFSKVYTWNDRLVNDKNIKKFCIPALNINHHLKVISFKKKKLLAVINSNIAVPYPFWALSPFKQELYSERIKAIDYFEASTPQNFYLYGRGWNSPKKFSLIERLIFYKRYKSFKGSIPRNANSKIKILSKYKFNLCFENCRADGYISEKIIDCFKAHTVPIYYGAPNIEDFIPKSCYVDYRDFSNNQSLLKFITSMDETTYDEYVENGIRYLNENFKKNWSEEKFMKTFLEAVNL